MSFVVDLAAAMDEADIECRAHDATLFVPISSAVEMRFEEIEAPCPAAEVFVAAANAADEDVDFIDALVAVVFSVEEALATVSAHIGTNQVVTILDELLEGEDERIAELSFAQDLNNPHIVRADVGQHAGITVCVDAVGDCPLVSVDFVVHRGNGSDALSESMPLGDCETWDQLCDILSTAVARAERWEQQLAPIDSVVAAEEGVDRNDGSGEF